LEFSQPSVRYLDAGDAFEHYANSSASAAMIQRMPHSICDGPVSNRNVSDGKDICHLATGPIRVDENDLFLIPLEKAIPSLSDVRAPSRPR
jgi:hypothetical protein